MHSDALLDPLLQGADVAIPAGATKSSPSSFPGAGEGPAIARHSYTTATACLSHRLLAGDPSGTLVQP